MTADFIDYNLLEADFKAAVLAQPQALGFKQVFTDASERDFIYDNMPLLDIRFKVADPTAITNATYYTIITMECEVAAYSFQSREEAAKLRGELVNKLQKFVKDNPRWSAQLETTTIGRADFGTGESKAEGAFVAGAVLEFHPQLYTE